LILIIYFFFMKMLAAPMLADDFYLNLFDWSSQNVLSVGLGSRVYLRPACTEQVTQSCNLSSSGDCVTSVAWNEWVSHNSISTFLCVAVNLTSVKSEYHYCLFC
jgi:cell division cycle 20-like protein 1 (cofactor of APC complex)